RPRRRPERGAADRRHHRLPRPARAGPGGRRQRVLDRAAGGPAPGVRQAGRPGEADRRRRRHPAAEFAVRLRGLPCGVRLRGVHPVHRAGPARPGGARRPAARAVRGTRRQDRRDPGQERPGAHVRRPGAPGPLLVRAQPARRRRRRDARRPRRQVQQTALQGPGPLRRPERTRGRRDAHRLRRGSRRLEDRLGPCELRGLSRRPDDAAVHLAGLRLGAGRAARAGPGAAGRPRAREGTARRPAGAGVLLQEPAGDGRALPGRPVRPAARLRQGAVMRALLELVRAPAALSVPGDTLAGAAAAGRRPAAGLALASVLMYWSGMALNDWADREEDAAERPGRPIPAGRISPGAALGLAAAPTGAGLAPPALADARRGDSTAAGPAALAASRVLDVLLGAGDQTRAARPAAPPIGAHTYGISVLGRAAVTGAAPGPAARALAASTVAAGLAAVTCVRGGAAARAGAGVLIAGYLASTVPVQAGLRTLPDPGNVRRAVRLSILGLIPLQAAVVAGGGRFATAGALLCSLPAGRWLSSRVATS